MMTNQREAFYKWAEEYALNEEPLTHEGWLQDCRAAWQAAQAVQAKCNCTMTQKLVGDGCQKCNPELTIDMLELNIQDLEQENAQLQLDNGTLRKALEEIILHDDSYNYECTAIAKEALSITSQPESAVRNYQTVQKPLSDEAINSIVKEHYNWFAFARAIEKAHNIGE
jgi:regulator of replication initiation timing